MARLERRSVNLNEDPGIAQLAVAFIFGLLALLAVILRILSRRLSKTRLAMNDYMIFLGLAATLVMAIATVISVVDGGAGLHKDQLSSDELRVFWKSMFAVIISWPIAQSATKISILLFYLHLFPTRKFRLAAYSLLVVLSAWALEQILATLFLCQPISYNWNGSIDGHCGSVAVNCIAGAAINTLTDIIILILPMPIIWRLQVPLRNKFILSLIFGFGFFICIISIIRLRTLLAYSTAPMMVLYDSDGPYGNNLPILYTIVESSLGIICACLVLMKPLLTHWKPAKSIKSRFSSLVASRDSAPSSWSNGGSGKLPPGVAHARNMSRQDGSLGSRDTPIFRNDERSTTFLDLEAAEHSKMNYAEKEGPPQWGGIQQTRDIEISYERR
ncbi:MAG: hypothetical protein Q9212_000689 [Teloschistes hypoglaucus]